MRARTDYGFFLALGLTLLNAFSLLLIAAGVLDLFPTVRCCDAVPELRRNSDDRELHPVRNPAVAIGQNRGIGTY